MSETEFRFLSEEDASVAEPGVELLPEDISTTEGVPAPEEISATETDLSPGSQRLQQLLGRKKEFASPVTRRMRSNANSAGPAIPSLAIAKRGTAQGHSLSTVLPRYKACVWLQVFLPQKAASRRRFDLKKPAEGKMSWWIMDPR